jgi:NAD(P)-dependent dehydrogenase (short-subunit alcohol dehydrogenase family)
VNRERLRKIARFIAWGAVIASFPVWFAAFFVAPFLPLSTTGKGIAAGIFIASGEALFWLGGLVLGAEVVARFRGPRVRTGKSLAGLRVAVIGANGGLGAAVARAVVREGGAVVLIARDAARIEQFATELQPPVVVADLSAEALRRAANEAGALDHVVVAAGVDVRRPLREHTDDDVRLQLEIGLAGPIHVTRAFLPTLRKAGSIAFLGGFGDGSLAMPYYSADVAARAGLAGFCAAMNRELQVEGRDERLCYVGPLPTETEAEREFLPLWRKLGSTIVKPEDVADFVLAALLAGKRVAVMGLSTRVLLYLGALVPGLVDTLVVRRWGPHLRRVFAPGAAPE